MQGALRAQVGKDSVFEGELKKQEVKFLKAWKKRGVKNIFSLTPEMFAFAAIRQRKLTFSLWSVVRNAGRLGKAFNAHFRVERALRRPNIFISLSSS